MKEKINLLQEEDSRIHRRQADKVLRKLAFVAFGILFLTACWTLWSDASTFLDRVKLVKVLILQKRPSAIYCTKGVFSYKKDIFCYVCNTQSMFTLVGCYALVAQLVKRIH